MSTLIDRVQVWVDDPYFAWVQVRVLYMCTRVHNNFGLRSDDPKGDVSWFATGWIKDVKQVRSVEIGTEHTCYYVTIAKLN